MKEIILSSGPGSLCKMAGLQFQPVLGCGPLTTLVGIGRAVQSTWKPSTLLSASLREGQSWKQALAAVGMANNLDSFHVLPEMTHHTRGVRDSEKQNQPGHCSEGSLKWVYEVRNCLNSSRIQKQWHRMYDSFLCIMGGQDATERGTIQDGGSLGRETRKDEEGENELFLNILFHKKHTDGWTSGSYSKMSTPVSMLGS